MKLNYIKNVLKYFENIPQSDQQEVLGDTLNKLLSNIETVLNSAYNYEYEAYNSPIISDTLEDIENFKNLLNKGE